MRKFPVEIYVTHEGEGEDTYLGVTDRGIDSIDEDGRAVAVYRLVSVGKVRITKQFESTQVGKRRK